MSTKSLHLLWLTENYYPSKGGMAESCDRIVHHLRQAGMQIDVLHLSQRHTRFQSEQVQGGQNLVFPLEEDVAHTLNVVWNYLSQTSDKHHWTQLVAFGGYLPILGAPILASWLQLPLVTLIRGNDLDAAIFYPRRREILKDALLQSARVCAVSQDKVFKINRLYPSVKMVYTPNGIDLANWQLLASDQMKAEAWRSEHVKAERRVIGLFGHLKAKKGILFFLKALGLSGWAEQSHLLFVGELNEEVAEFLEDYQDRFHYTQYGFMERFSLLPYYAACDVVAIPSFYDGLPNVLLEAGGLGVPFLASRVAGMADVLEDQTHGFLFQAGDLKDCARAIYEFYQNDEKRLQKMGENCQQLIQKNLNHQLETERYWQVFQEVQAEHQPSV